MPASRHNEVVKVREIEESEFEAVANLRVDAFLAAGMVKDRGTPYAQYLRTVPDHAQHGHVLVAYEDEILVGTVTIAPPGSPHADIAVAGEWEVRFLAVAVDAWGTGVGDALMASCNELARTAGVHNLALSVISDNAAAHQLYARLGFIREPNRDFSPTAEVLLEVYTRPVN